MYLLGDIYFPSKKPHYKQDQHNNGVWKERN